MHPLILISASVLVGVLFALQEWMNAHRWGYRISVVFLIEMWGMQFLIWGAICWLMWRFLRPFIVQANVVSLMTRALPLSIATSILEEMIWVIFFPRVPVDRPPMDYWHRLSFQLNAEFVDSMAIFWIAFLFLRGRCLLPAVQGEGDNGGAAAGAAGAGEAGGAAHAAESTFPL